MNNPFEQAHYERSDLWGEDNWRHAELDQQRANMAARLLPSDVRSILDAGSGNGIFERSSGDRHWAVALDRSLAALRHIGVPRCQGDVMKLPFPEDSFDALLSMEVIEHLPDENYMPTLSEFARIPRRYILITVPYCEDLEKSKITCPQCQFQFHRYFHQRSYDEKKLVSLFAPWTNIRCVSVKGICEVKSRKFAALWQITSRIFRRKGTYFPINATCPRCGYQGKKAEDELLETNPSRASSKVKNWVKSNWPVHSTYVWWLALYEKRDRE